MTLDDKVLIDLNTHAETYVYWDVLSSSGSYYWVIKLSGGGTIINVYWLGIPVMVVLAVLVGYLCSRYPIRMLGSLKPKDLIGGVYKE